MSDRFLTTVAHRAPGDHVCWSFHGPDDFVATTRAYVAEGLGRHERVAYLRIGPDGLRLTTVRDAAQVAPTRGGSLPVAGPTAVVPWAVPTDPAVELGRLTRAALADGYTGMRVVTDATEVARAADSRRPWIRSEHLIDRCALDHPLTVLCGYDVDDLGEDVVAEAACVHALTQGDLSPFLLRAADADGALALSGEVDVASADELHRAVVTIGPELPSRTVVHAGELRFIDHTALAALDSAARSLAVTLVLVGVSPLTAWLVATLRLTNVTALPAAPPRAEPGGRT